jgi:hypothetical protein
VLYGKKKYPPLKANESYGAGTTDREKKSRRSRHFPPPCAPPSFPPSNFFFSSRDLILTKCSRTVGTQRLVPGTISHLKNFEEKKQDENRFSFTVFHFPPFARFISEKNN